jgi:hypothetical protein
MGATKRHDRFCSAPRIHGSPSSCLLSRSLALRISLSFSSRNTGRTLKTFLPFEVAKYMLAPSRMPAFAGYDAEEVWEKIQARKRGEGESSSSEPDLKIPEWEVFTQRGSVPVTKDFKISRVAPPQGYAAVFEETVLLECCWRPRESVTQN